MSKRTYESGARKRQLLKQKTEKRLELLSKVPTLDTLFKSTQMETDDVMEPTPSTSKSAVIEESISADVDDVEVVRCRVDENCI